MARLSFREDFILEYRANNEEKKVEGTFRQLTKQETKQNEEEYKAITDKTKILIKKQKKFNSIAKSINRKSSIEPMTSELDNQITQEEIKYDQIEKEIEELQAELEDISVIDRMFRKRLDLCLNEESKEDVFKLCETWGYQKVFQTIEKDIEEKK